MAAIQGQQQPIRTVRPADSEEKNSEPIRDERLIGRAGRAN